MLVVNGSTLNSMYETIFYKIIFNTPVFFLQGRSTIVLLGVYPVVEVCVQYGGVRMNIR